MDKDEDKPTGVVENTIDLESTSLLVSEPTVTGRKKRPREQEADGQDQEEEQDPSSSLSSPLLPPPSAYGTKQYWEDRYKKSRRPSHRLKKNGGDDGGDNANANAADVDHKDSNNGNKNDDGDDDDVPDPFHAWYFTFEELAPLLLPLILGGDDDDDDNDDDEEEQEEEEEEGDDEEEKDQDSSNNNNVNRMNHRNSDEKDRTKEEEDDELAEIEEEETEEGHDENEAMDDEDGILDSDDDGGLIKNGPISVLEIGCGDVPLGRDLVVAIEEIHDNSNTNNNDANDDVKSESNLTAEPTSIIEKVVCIDYSQNVIDAMNEELKELRDENDNASTDASAMSNKKKKKTIPLSYEVADARKLSHDEESFHMILEKGTLDAMLSSGDAGGSDNCRQIVSECARVLKKGGIIVVISHVNAYTDTGLQWLNDIIVPGLRKGAGQFPWRVEVHGNEPNNLLSDNGSSNNNNNDNNDDDDDEEEEDNDSNEESSGPCVYIIKKGTTEFHDDKFDPKNPPTIPLMFFNY